MVSSVPTPPVIEHYLHVVKNKIIFEYELSRLCLTTVADLTR